MKKALLFSGSIALILGVALLSSCSKDLDGSNWSPTQALPPDTTDNNTDIPNDTLSLDTNAFEWHALIIGDNAFDGDSASAIYSYDSIAALHIFECLDDLGRHMTIRLSDLNTGEHVISFENSNYIALVDNASLFDTNFLPSGSIIISSNSNGRITASFESELYDIGGSGQMKELVDGVLRNVQYQ